MERNGEIQISETTHFEGRLIFDPLLPRST